MCCTDHPSGRTGRQRSVHGEEFEDLLQRELRRRYVQQLKQQISSSFSDIERGALLLELSKIERTQEKEWENLLSHRKGILSYVRERGRDNFGFKFISTEHHRSVTLRLSKSACDNRNMSLISNSGQCSQCDAEETFDCLRDESERV